MALTNFMLKLSPKQRSAGLRVVLSVIGIVTFGLLVGCKTRKGTITPKYMAAQADYRVIDVTDSNIAENSVTELHEKTTP